MVKLSKIYEALQFVSSDNEIYYILDTDEIFQYIPFISDESELDELIEHDYIHMPSQYDINEKSMMIDYAYTVDDNLQDRLLDVLHRKGAYSNFKNILKYNGTINDWYKYRDKCYLKLAKRLLEDNEIDFINDMEENLCEICHKNVASITRDGQSICDKCNNKLVDELGDDFECPDSISLKINKKNMTFNLSMVKLPNIVIWCARDVKKIFEIRMYSQLDSDLALEYEEFLEKIKKEVEFKSIKGSFLRTKGNIEVGYQEFIIDGIRFTPNELYRLLSCYEGFVLEYDLKEKADDHLGKDEYLVKKVITNNTIINDCDKIINKYIYEEESDDNFLFDILDVISDIKILYNHEKDVNNLCDELITRFSMINGRDNIKYTALEMLEKIKNHIYFKIRK